MGRVRQRVVIAAGIVLVILLLAAGAWLSILRTAFPRTRGTMTVKGLSAPVEVLRDRYGVPHIRAASMHDL